MCADCFQFPCAGEANETDQRQRYVGLCGLFVFYYKLFKPNLDKKFFKQIYMVHKKVARHRGLAAHHLK